MSTNNPRRPRTDGRRDVPMNTADLVVGQKLVRVTKSSTWATNAPVRRREDVYTVKAILKTRLVLTSDAQAGKELRVIVDYSRTRTYGNGSVTDKLEGEGSLGYSNREFIYLYTVNDPALLEDRAASEAHNAKAIPFQQAKGAILGAYNGLNKETATAAVEALQAYLAALDD